MNYSLTDIVDKKTKEAANITAYTRRGKSYDICGNYLLQYFYPAICRLIDERALTEAYVKQKRDRCIRCLQAAGQVHSTHYNNALQALNEIFFYDMMASKHRVLVYDDTKETLPNADLVVLYKQSISINLELKTISFIHADQTLIEYQKLQAEAKKNYTPIAFSPFQKFLGEIPNQRKYIIEIFIDKVNAQFRPAQVNAGGNRGLLVIDTLILGFPYFPQDGLRTFLHPPFSRFPRAKNFSGCLWYACFGKKGDVVTDFSGDLILEKDGVLAGFSTSPEALVFIIRLGGGHTGKTYLMGFHRSTMKDETLRSFLTETCDFVNTEHNDNPNKFPIDPMETYKALDDLVNK